MTIVDFVRMTRKALPWLVLSVILGTLAAGVFTYFQPVVYQAKSTGYVVAGSSESVDAAFSGSSLASQKALQYLPLASTRAVANRVNEDLKASGRPDTAGAISASLVTNSSILEVVATSSTAEGAQAVADAGVRALAAEIRRLETLDPTAVQGEGGQSIDDLKATGTSTIMLVPYEPAGLPGAPISPNWPRNLLIGAVAGLLAGYGVVLLARALDLKVRNTKDVENFSEGSVLGVIPSTSELAKQRKGGKGLATMGVASEAMRQLRTNLRFVNVDNRPRSIVVTSANPGEGKSTIASNLARVLAEAGQPVVLVDADMRRPVQAKAFELDGSVGITQVLAGDVDVEDALQETETPRLRLLAAGRIPPNPSELAGSQNMAALIDTLARDNMVIIDAPPLLPVTDAGLLTAASDGAILIARVGKTYKEQVRHCAKLLNQIENKLLGTALNMAPLRSMGDVTSGYYGYGGYKSGYYGSSEPVSDTVLDVTPHAPQAETQTETAATAAPRRGSN